MTGRIGPLYQQVADDIRSKIASGEYQVGDPIPSTLKLQKQYGASDSVIRHAVSELQKDGILEGHPGKAVFVKAMPEDVASERQDIKTLSEQVAGLQREVHELTERANAAQPADFARDLDELRETVGRIEVNLIDLYGKLGHEYDGAKATARRGRSRR